MNKTAGIGITILLAVSVLVRVAPAFVRLPLAAHTIARIEAVVPVAVLINLAVFSAVSEIHARPLPALAGLLVLAVLFAWRRLPVILVVALASVAYASVGVG